MNKNKKICAVHGQYHSHDTCAHCKQEKCADTLLYVDDEKMDYHVVLCDECAETFIIDLLKTIKISIRENATDE